MKRILYAWEMGGGLGHVSRFLPLARELETRGCAITWVVIDPAPVATLLGAKATGLLQAPRFPGEITGLPEPQLAYSEMIMRYGFLAPEMLLPQLRAWRQIMQEARPDLVITDHAPTALLAARSLGLATARIGTGFCCPPVQDPEPPLMSGRQADATRVAESAYIVLAAINGALDVVGAPRLAAFSEMHRADEDFVTTYAGLDHYAQRATPRWGVILGAEGGDAPDWPAGRGPRVFAYLKAGLPQTDVLLRALRRKQCTALVYCPGLSQAQRINFERAGLRFVERPLDIEAVTATCDLVICGGGHGTVCAALLAGKPLLIAPYLIEQGITSLNVEALGAGLNALMGLEGQYGSLLTRLFLEPGFTRAAQAFRAQYGSISQRQIVSAIADRCMELV